MENILLLLVLLAIIIFLSMSSLFSLQMGSPMYPRYSPYPRRRRIMQIGQPPLTITPTSTPTSLKIPKFLPVSPQITEQDCLSIANPGGIYCKSSTNMGEACYNLYANPTTNQFKHTSVDPSMCRNAFDCSTLGDVCSKKSY